MDTKIDVKVIPKSSKSTIYCDDSKKIKIYLTSPPVDGKANMECIKVLSKKLGTAKSNISIIKGSKSREKRICIKNMTEVEVFKKISV